MTTPSHESTSKEEETLSTVCEQNEAKHEVKISEIVRLMAQALQDLGLDRTVNVLEDESTVSLEDEIVVDFRRAVLTGDLDDAEHILPPTYTNNLQEIQLILRRQKFVELIEAHQNEKALEVLQSEVTPLETDQARLHQMASLLFCSNESEIQEKMNWSGSDIQTREQLLEYLTQYIHPSKMIPRKRFSQLLAQALEWQRLHCVFHDNDSAKESPSLFVDHYCVDRDKLPLRTLHILRGHTDEVWYVAFSHNGDYLASASRDNKCIVWNMKNYETKKILRSNGGITYCAWSPDDSKLLTCNYEHSLCSWSIAETSQRPQEFMAHTDQVTCCAWLPDGQRFISGACDNKLYCWDVNGSVIGVRQGVRPVDMKITSDGNRMVTASFDRHVIIYSLHFQGNELIIAEICRIPQPETITSLSLSFDGRFAVVNVQMIQEIHLWDLNRQRLMKRYQGHKHNAYIIRSCFSGRNQTLIVSGSQDNKVYLWHREKQNVLAALDGHSKVVNCVSWCPTGPPRFASASDDGTVRIWGPPIDIRDTEQSF